MPILDQTTAFSELPSESALPPQRAHAKLVVLDDDPTGTQTVHGIPVLTTWDESILATELLDPAPAVFLLTNTRAYPVERVVAINREIGVALRAASKATGRDFVIVSRSDSTLRGHYPAETDALAEGLGGVDAVFIIPAFFPGGRYTLDDVHYVAEAGRLVPAGETEFARDASFGYRHSNLREWVAEKTGGRVPAAEVVSISLADLREGGPSPVTDKLVAMRSGSVVIVNAVSPTDLAVLTHALGDKRLKVRRFLFRTAADFVSAYAAITSRPILGPSELCDKGSNHGGLIVAGSYVGKTTAQLDALFTGLPALVRVEISVSKLLDPLNRDAECARAGNAAEAAIVSGRSVVLYTSRLLVTGSDAQSSLAIGHQISLGLVGVVCALKMRPAWFIAKGGITSSDLATRALKILRAIVVGQALPGVPVWQTGIESKWPGLCYVVFPGNVGDSDALAELVASLEVRTADPTSACCSLQ